MLNYKKNILNYKTTYFKLEKQPFLNYKNNLF